MAVQTHQYFSNALHLKRKEQEMNSTGFEALNESSTLLSTIGGYMINPKEGNQYLIQSQPSIPRPQKIIRLDQYQQRSHNPALKSTGLQLASGEQNLSQNVNQINPLLSSSPLCEDFSSSVGQYSKELDQLLQAQGEQLRQALAKSQQSHYKQLLQHLEKSAAKILTEKQTELNQLIQHTSKLQNHLAQLQSESFGWQSKAIKSQTIANSIRAQVQQIQQESVVAEDAGSSCTEPNRTDPDDGRLSCRVCRSRAVSVVVLPCRHLCLCEDCDGGGEVKACPVCDCVGSGSVRVFLCLRVCLVGSGREDSPPPPVGSLLS
ncbi:E3 ubiquitin-protein ligase BOI-like [Asparagus officinalis]|uniref:E3 ubiquitin-protein ligase BOI-like n=1 Tax=Asparagus officinalis TaxID=4686 RepID=UPI00098E2623|nr:E3 ubiquitin-protein ligase BOI-like [Asparagus officinalis]